MESFVKFAVIVIINLIIGLLVSFPVFILWNSCLVPAVTFAHEISWLQAWGLSILAGFLFKDITVEAK